MRPNFKFTEMGGLSWGGIIFYYFTISMHLKSDLIKWVVSVEGDN
jgi:hypothetical protein